MTDFDAVAAAVAGVPFMSSDQGRIIYDHVRATRPRAALELGTAHGVGSAYIAAALRPEARLTTVDFAGASYDPSPEDVLARAGVADRVEIVRRYSTYTWWLKEQLPGGEQFDFVYLDGAKNWTIDGLAVYLIERLLRPGGWLLLDDLHWRYDDTVGREISDGVTIRSLSEAERSEPHLRAVFDQIIAPHPSFAQLRIQDDWWGWARKAPGAPKTLSIETTRTPSALVATALRRTRRRIRRLRRKR